MSRIEIIHKAREIVAENGGQEAVAARLGKSQPAVAKALRETDVTMDKLRIRILREIGGLDVDEGPYIRLPVKKPAPAKKVAAKKRSSKK